MEQSRFDNINVNINQDVQEHNANIADLDVLPMDKQESIRFGQDTKHRQNLVTWMMWVVGIWLGMVLIITICGFFLSISDSVLITLLTTTTLNVLGLSKIILSGLFGSSH